MATKIGDMAVYISANTYALARDLTRASSMVGSFAGRVSRQMADAARPLTSFMRDVSAIAGGNLLASGIKQAVVGMSDLVSGSIRLAAEAEATEMKYSALLGSAKEAKRLMGDLRGFAAESPISLGAASEQATRLLGAGISRDQVTPTLRALTDASMGDTESLKGMVRAYTQIKSTGRLQGDEWNQLANAGTLTLKDLGKALGVAEDQVLRLRDQGQISFRDVQKAIKLATEEGGRFYGLGEKYSQTFAGRLDKLQDGWEDIKKAFGQTLIEEWGLKDAADDMGAFMERVKGYINDLRPTLKMVGDIGKGLVQLLAESGRAAGLIAGAASSIFGQRFPETIKSMKDGIGNLKEFKFDPVGVVNFGVRIAEGIADAIEAVRPVWRSFVDDFVTPIRDAILDIGNLPTNAKAKIGKLGDDFIGGFLPGGAFIKDDLTQTRKNAAESRVAGADLAALRKEFGLDQSDAMALLTQRANVAALTDEYGKLDAEFKKLGADYGALKDAGKAVPAGMEDNLRALFVRHGDISMNLDRARQQVAGLESKGRKTDDYMKPIREYAAQMKRRDQYDQDMKAFRTKLDAGTVEGARPLVRGIADAMARGLMSPLAGGSFAGFAGLRRDKMALDDSFPTRLSDLARTLNEKFVDPVAEYGRKLKDLDALRDAGKITGDVYALGYADLVGGLAGSAGGPMQLASGVELGSQQLATMVARAGIGSGPQTVEGLLKVIAEYQRQQLESAKQLVTNTGSKPPVVHIPQ